MRSACTLVGSLSIAALVAAAPLHADKTVQKTLPLAADGEVRIDTYKGTITVTAGTSNQVEVVARVTPDGDDRDQPRKVEETEIRIGGGGSSISIESDYDKVKGHGWSSFLGGFGNDGTLPLVHYTVKMPATARLVVKDYKSESRIAGVGDVTFETYKGKAQLSGLRKPTRIETYKGDIRVDFEAFEGGRFDTYKGRIAAHLPRDARFDLDADRGKRGEVDSDFSLVSGGESRRYRSRRHDDDERLRASVNGGGPRLSFETYKGTLELKSR